MPHRFDVWTLLFAALLLAIPGLASGAYFLRLTGGGEAKTHRLTVVR